MTTAATPEALVDGAHDMPTEAEIEAMREEAENFRLPAPPPTPVRGRFYLTECEHCGWVGSSEHCGGNCGPDDDDIVCPVCCSSICGDAPEEADEAKFGEAVYQRIVTAETALATATAEAASLRAEVEAKDRRIAELSETWTDEGGTVWSPPTAWAYAKACAALHKHRAEVEALKGALHQVKTWIDTDLPAGTSRAGTMHRVVTKALDRTALARAATAGEGRSNV
ncbi:hypothetical protein [Methylorubrum extorquens]